MAVLCRWGARRKTKEDGDLVEMVAVNRSREGKRGSKAFVNIFVVEICSLVLGFMKHREREEGARGEEGVGWDYFVWLRILDVRGMGSFFCSDFFWPCIFFLANCVWDLNGNWEDRV